MVGPNGQRDIVIREDGGKRPIRLEDRDFLASGTMGDVYRLNRQGYPGACVKLYKIPNAAAMDKLRAMLDKPPAQLQTRLGATTYVQFAWPTQLVEDKRGKGIGFVMPEVDYQNTFSLVTYTEPREARRFLTPEQRSLRRRVSVARNVAAKMADLHANGHAFVDFKDQNVRIYPDTGLVAFVDNDGFRIQAAGGKIYPGLHTTPTFNSPESANGQRQQLGEHHDRFVLAILLFRLLNFGIHPFQGVPTQVHDNTPFDIDQFITQQTYAYGVRRSPLLNPTRGSIHEHWDVKTQAMFEQTFLSTKPEQRVSALEWARHFRQLEEQGGFVKCPNHPQDIEHVHFPNRACPICTLKAQPQSLPPLGQATSQSTTGNAQGTLPSVAGHAPSCTATALPPPITSMATGTKWALAIGALLMAYLIISANL